MIEIATRIGPIRINSYSRNHCRRNGHQDPEKDRELQMALMRGDFVVTETVPSHWRERQTRNIALLVNSVARSMRVIVKEMPGFLMVVTSYPPKPNQVRQMLAESRELNAA